MEQPVTKRKSAAARLRRVSFALGLISVALIVIAALAQLLRGKIEVDVMMGTPDQGGPGWRSVDAILGWMVASVLFVPITGIGAVVAGLRARPRSGDPAFLFADSVGISSVVTSAKDPTVLQATAGTKAPDRAVVTWLAVGFSALSLILRFMTGGWYIILFGIPYLAVCGIHLGIHRFAGARLPLGVTNLVALLGSNLILLLAFLLQEDAGDGPSWVTITALLRGGPGSDGAIPPAWFSSFLPLLAVVPIAVSWFALLALSMPIGRRLAVRICGVVGLVGLVAVLAAVLVAVVASPPGPVSY